MTEPWSPFPGAYRPTASTINDPTLDIVLERLERAEAIVDLITERAPWGRNAGADPDVLFKLVRAYIHNRHVPRMPLISKLKRRTPEQCPVCTHRAMSISWRWSDRGQDLSEADEARLGRVSHLIELTHPTMAWPDESVGLKAREELPWLMSVIRRLQRDVRRERGAYQAQENRLVRATDAERGLTAEVKRLRKKIAEEI